MSSPCRSEGMVLSLGVTLTRNAHTVRMLIMRRKSKRKKKKVGKEDAYMLGELRNKVRSVYPERLFPSAESRCAQSKLFSESRTEMPPWIPSANDFVLITHWFSRGRDQFYNTAVQNVQR